MVKVKTANWQRVVREIKRLELAGCEIVRLAIRDEDDIKFIPKIKERTKIPLVGDIHFQYQLALKGIEAGLDKIRINPGNIKERWQLEEIANLAKDKEIPIRIGLNTGSFRNLTKVSKLFSGLKRTVELFEKKGFFSLVLSAKTPDPLLTIEVYQKIAGDYPYPLHLGLTEAGLPFEGGIRTALTLSPLLRQGIGDTIRVSLTGDAVLEVAAGYEILQGLGLRRERPVFISCPTCGRCQVDLVRIAQMVKRELEGMKRFLKIAVMGCEVNGPGEAQQADYGIACGRGSGLIFKKGNVLKKMSEKNLIEEFVSLVKSENLTD